MIFDINGKEIKVNSRLMVVKPTLCCNDPRTLGRIFTVSKIDITRHHCQYCNTQSSSEEMPCINAVVIHPSRVIVLPDVESEDDLDENNIVEKEDEIVY